MRQTLLFLLLLSSTPAFTQSLTLSRKIQSLETLNQQVPTLARQLLALYESPDRITYLDNRFRLEMAAGQFAEALKTLDSSRQAMGIAASPDIAAVGIQFQTYALTRMGNATAAQFFQAYSDTLAAVYARLPLEAQTIAAEFFSGDTTQIGQQLQKLIEEISDKDAITIDEARLLVRNWNSYTVYRQVLPPGRRFLENEDNKKYVIEDSLLIPGHGNALLSAVVVRPRNLNGPAPVILTSNIYAGPGDKNRAKEAAAQGYVGVVINTRGKFRSPDAIEPYEHDGADIYAALDWISKQPWCNGKAGMYGGSYLGFSQWAALKKVHPILKTAVPQVAVGAGIDFPRFNGVGYGYSLQWIHYVSNNKLTDYPEFSNAARWTELFNKWFQSGLPFRKLDSLDGRPNALFQRWLDHPEFDRFWQQTIPVDQDFAKINIPLLTITGYFDDDQRGALHYYMQHHNWNKKADHYLFIGPFDHGGAQSNSSTEVRGYTVDSVGVMSINDLVWDWFNYQLRDGEKPKQLLNKITYQVMGTNEWKGAPSLKEISNDSLKLFLTHRFSEGSLSLQSQKPVKQGWLEYSLDFTKRPLVDYTPMIQSKALPPLNHLLVFMSDPLEKDLIMNGSMSGSLQLILNKKDADLSFDLYEYTADSNYILLSSTTERISFVLNPRKRTLVQPGKPLSLPVYNAYFSSRKLQKGSRLVLVAGGIRDAGMEINYGSGKPVADESIADGKVPLQIQWSNQSYITIPVKR